VGGDDVISAAQRQVIDAIVSIFETDQLPSIAAYSTVAILSDNAGISYGIHQATAASSLPRVLAEYERLEGRWSGRIRPYVHRLPETCKLRPGRPVPEWVEILLELLREAGADPLMQQAQRLVFDRDYWVPASTYASSIGLVTALSHLVLYDTRIQSRPSLVDELRPTFKALPPSRGGSEATWTSQFLAARRKFLATFESKDEAREADIRRSVYRVDALLGLVTARRWSLATPLVVRGHRIVA
jgi:glycosyl hydrolase family 46